jgi:hypothetical protein
MSLKNFCSDHRQLLIGVIYFAGAVIVTAAVVEFVPPPIKFILLVFPCGVALFGVAVLAVLELWSLLTATERGQRIGRAIVWVMAAGIGGFLILWIIAVSPLFNLVVRLHADHQRSTCSNALAENDDPSPCPAWFRRAVCHGEPQQHPWCSQ